MDRLKTILIKPEITIKQALKHMDEVGKKTLFVVDDKDRLCGAVTDGDIRRWILKGASLNGKVVKVMNKNPIFLKEGYSKETAKKLMTSNVIDCLPVVDGQKRIISAIWWLDLFASKFKKQRKIDAPVVIMAGGEGSRLLPFTKILPKPLVPIGEKPIIEIIIERFVEYGCNNFYLSLNYKSDIVKAYFSNLRPKYSIYYVQEKKPLGTAGSISLLRNKIKSTFIVSNCDILIDADYADILKFHRQQKNKITLITSMKHFTIPYGVCEIENGGLLKNIREKPEYDLLVNTGMYILEVDVLADIPKNKLYNITDLIIDYLNKGRKIGVYPVSEKSWLDMGQFEALQEMLKHLQNKL